MTDARLLYVTAKDRDEALRIGRALVEQRLAACANVLPGAESIYWWDGKVQQEPEAVLILKTTGARVERVVEEVRRLHSYSDRKSTRLNSSHSSVSRMPSSA